MHGLTEIRWHARAGQGAKTASQVLALALLRSGRSVQSFPEYGPERRGAPLRAYTRFADGAIRRHDAIEHPDVVVVLDESLLEEPSVREGVSEGTRMLVNRRLGRMANIVEKTMPHVEGMEPGTILARVDDVEKLDKVARRTFGISDDDVHGNNVLVNIGILGC